jgi:hypothetical protein
MDGKTRIRLESCTGRYIDELSGDAALSWNDSLIRAVGGSDVAYPTTSTYCLRMMETKLPRLSSESVLIFLYSLLYAKVQ